MVTADVLSLLGTSFVFAEDTNIAAKTDLVSLLEVPLRCEAAPEIGCGSRSKPILLELEREPIITEAWLNDTGTVLAVVGAEGSTREAQSKAIQTILEKNGAMGTELEGEEQLGEELSAIAHENLDAKEIVAFQDAVAKGIRPQPDDQEETKTEKTTPDCCSLKSAG